MLLSKRSPKPWLRGSYLPIGCPSYWAALLLAMPAIELSRPSVRRIGRRLAWSLAHGRLRWPGAEVRSAAENTA